MDLRLNVGSQSEHRALHDTSQHVCLGIGQDERQRVHRYREEQSAMECGEIHFGLAIAFRQAIEQNVGCMTKYARA